VEDKGSYSIARWSNSPPLAVDNRYPVQMDTPLAVAAPGVLVNDSDPEADPLAAALARSPLSGTLDLSSTGSLVYTPPVSYTGLVTFTYTASDLYGAEGTAAVSIDVVPRIHRVHLSLVLKLR
jgi:hypothetical protein